MPSGSPTLVTLFIGPLNRLELTYMVTGSVAAGMYGEPRLTNDVDLIVALADGDARRVAGAFDPVAFYVPPEEVIEIERLRPLHGHFNVIHRETSLRADVYLAGLDPMHESAFGRRTRVIIDREPVWVAPPDYVILRKLQYVHAGASAKHIEDARAMIRMMGDRIDRPTLEAAISQLGLQDEWQRVTRPRR